MRVYVSEVVPRTYYALGKKQRLREAEAMGDPYYIYRVPADIGGSVPRSSFPGDLPSEAPSLSSYPPSGSTDLRGNHSPYFQGDINPSHSVAYGYNDFRGDRVLPETFIGGTRGEANMKVGSSLDEPKHPSNGPDINGISDIGNARPGSQNINNIHASVRESNVLFVDGLPTDCTRREVGHLFRPFFGYKEIRIVHKEPRRSGEKAMVFCFVEFIDSRHASIAMEALQGYRFDDKKLDSHILKIQFAHFPFRVNRDKQ